MNKASKSRVALSLATAVLSTTSMFIWTAADPKMKVAAADSTHTVQVIINGRVAESTSSLLQHGSNYFRLSAVQTALTKAGLDVSWDSTTQELTVHRTGTVQTVVDTTFTTQPLNVITRQLPGTNTIQTYLPLWDVMALVKKVGVLTQWDGQMWTISTLGSAATVTPISHVIVIVQENHSFDNYFGTYPHAKGFKPLPGTPSVDGIPAGAYNIGPNGKKYTPFILGPGQTTTAGLPHGYFDMIRDYAGGKMSGFVTQDAAYMKKHHLSGSYGLPMGHYDYTTVGPYWEYAQHYGLADHWFQAVMGPTTTNMMYLVAARAGQNYHNAYYTSRPSQYDFTFPNIGDELSAHKISWTWYQGQWNTRRYTLMDNPFMFFKNYRLGDYNSHITSLNQFDVALNDGKLPAVSFLKPNGRDEHPGTNIELGVQYVTQTVNAVMKSKYWDSTAIIITWDESGGWYDHVAPPQTGLNIDGLQGDGPRVPTLIISPYAKQNFVSHQTYDTTSILRFIEYNWQLPSMNQKDAHANNILAFFNFTQPHDKPFLIHDQFGGLTAAGNKAAVKETTGSAVRSRSVPGSGGSRGATTASNLIGPDGMRLLAH